MKHHFIQQSVNFTMYGTVEIFLAVIGNFSLQIGKKSAKCPSALLRPLRHPKKSLSCLQMEHYSQLECFHLVFPSIFFHNPNLWLTTRFIFFFFFF